MIRRRGTPRLIVLAVVVAVATSLLPALAGPAHAAAPDLTITSDTRYVVDPGKGRVHVTAALTAVNHLKDTKTRTFYFDRAYLAVQPGTTGFRIASRGATPKVTVAERKADYTLLRIDFGKRLTAGATRAFALTFDLADAGGAPTRETRIGASLVSFAAWAYATPSTPGGSVSVTWPEGFNIEVQSADLRDPTTGANGAVTYATGTLAKPLSFFAYFIADRPNAFTETSLPVTVGGRDVEVAIRAWPDDPAWATRVGTVLAAGLPALSEAIGLPWLDAQELVVAEAISRSSGGFSGRYDPASGRIEVAYYADSLVVLHETAHAWFDGRLLADRWANEGFASLYADQVAASALELKVTPVPVTPELAKNRVPLNAWGTVGSDTLLVEDYGYAASAELARLIAERAGSSGLTSVWEAARQGIGAYQPAGLDASVGGGLVSAPGGQGSDAADVEAGAPAPDWRGLLDLLEDRTGQSYVDLWQAWVVRPSELGLLAERDAARRRYDQIVRRAGEWQLPPIVREAMRAWQFDQATELLNAADRVLDARDNVAAAAAAAGLAVPGAVRAAFEGNGSFAAATSEADAELQAIAAYEEAAATRPANPDIVVEVGLWTATPETDIAAAADAFAAGDLRRSIESSLNARTAWLGAPDLGRNRLVSLLGATILALIAVAFIVGRVRSLRRTWRERSAARAYARDARAVAARELSAPHSMAHRIEQDQRRRGTK